MGFHLVGYAPPSSVQWLAENLKNAILINVVLAVFNMIPLPPLDGGRIAVGLLPKTLAEPLSRVEPYGFLLLIGLLFVLPVLGEQFGLGLNFISPVISLFTNAIIEIILRLTANT